MSVSNQQFADRIRSLMRERHMTQQSLADELGVTKATVSLWWQGTLPRDDKRPVIARALGTTESHLFYGGRSPQASIGEGVANSTTSGFAVLRPLDGSDVGDMRLSNTTLAACKVAVPSARCFRMPDNSMGRTIPIGSLLAVDTASKKPMGGNVYVLEQQGLIRVARIYTVPAGGLRLRFDNTEEYPDEPYAQGEGLYPCVLGRVFWYAVTLL